MEGDGVDSVTSGIVVLDKTLTPNVPYLNGVIIGATGNTGAIWVEPDSIYSHVVVLESVDLALGSDIP